MYESISGSDNAELAHRVLGLLAHRRAGIVTDIDGTISPIVARPEEATVLPEALRALEGLKRKLALVAVVTGRSVDDARKMIGIDGLVYIGNHGLEVDTDGHAELIAEARPWVPQIAALLAELAQRLDPRLERGAIIENKGATASVHYRLTRDPERARTDLLEILSECAADRGIRVEEGRRVINLLPPLMVTKGSAVTWLVRERNLGAVVYLGDDITDAHAFRALDVLRKAASIQALSIAVAGLETPPSVRDLADAAVPSAAAVAKLLRAVLDGLESSDRMDSRAPGVWSN